MPLLTLSVCPSWVVPETTGRAVFTGAAPAATTAVWPDTAWAEPAELLAVTWMRIV